MFLFSKADLGLSGAFECVFIIILHLLQYVFASFYLKGSFRLTSNNSDIENCVNCLIQQMKN